MMVGHCHSHPHHHHHRHHHQRPHRPHRAGSSDSSPGCGAGNDASPPSTTPSSASTPSASDYSLAMSSSSSSTSSSEGGGGDLAFSHHNHINHHHSHSPHHHHSSSTVSLIESIERRTQRTYRYGIGLVCVGATLNWLGFAQGTTYIDPLRYLGVACVLTGSFCVCLAMCRWLGRPISVSGHHAANLEEDRSSSDVHVINVPVPMFVPPLNEDFRPTKPPDYEQIVAGEPPPYDEAIKLSPGAFFVVPPAAVTSLGLGVDAGESLLASHLSSCQPSPSHFHHHHHHSHPHQTSNNGDLTRERLLNHHEYESEHKNVHQQNLPTFHYEENDPPPAYETNTTPLIASSSATINSSRLRDLPPSFGVMHVFGNGGGGCSLDSSTRRINHQSQDLVSNVNNFNSNNDNNNNSSTSTCEHLQEQVNNSGAPQAPTSVVTSVNICLD